MSGKACIICVAITGSLPRKRENPAVPISVDEQIESTHEAFEAGASIVHCHVSTVRRLAPDAEWCAAGIGRHQLELNDWCIAAGGHCRTGLEDNVRLDRDTLAPSNAALVRRTVELCERRGRPVARSAQARRLLGLAT